MGYANSFVQQNATAWWVISPDLSPWEATFDAVEIATDLGQENLINEPNLANWLQTTVSQAQSPINYYWQSRLFQLCGISFVDPSVMMHQPEIQSDFQTMVNSGGIQSELDLLRYCVNATTISATLILSALPTTQPIGQTVSYQLEGVAPLTIVPITNLELVESKTMINDWENSAGVYSTLILPEINAINPRSPDIWHPLLSFNCHGQSLWVDLEHYHYV